MESRLGDEAVRVVEMEVADVGIAVVEEYEPAIEASVAGEARSPMGQSGSNRECQCIILLYLIFRLFLSIIFLLHFLPAGGRVPW